MGVNWFPCRVEPGITREEIDQRVRLEALHFRVAQDSGWLPNELKPLIHLTEVERAATVRAHQEAGRLSEHLLFKMESHRAYAITYDELFPLEWRLDAYRTLLPWELPQHLEMWTGYREQVAQGQHRDYLLELMSYLHSHHLAEFYQDQLFRFAQHARQSTASWARPPAVLAVCEKILSGPRPEILQPPRWPSGETMGVDACVPNLRTRHEEIAALVEAWNTVVQRGNYRIRDMPTLLDLEEWIAKRFANERFATFRQWVEPWVRGGYGLYRDCE